MENPYQILGLPATASKDDAQRAFYYVAKMYHPDKGGNPEQYNRFKWAYTQIMKGVPEPEVTTTRTWDQLRDVSQSDPNLTIKKDPDFNGEHGRFNQDNFNEVFNRQQQQQQHQNTMQSNKFNGFVYNIDDQQFKERKKNDYEREHSMITAEAESMTKMFQHGFDKNAFNRMFEHKKQKHKENSKEIEEITEPVPLSAGDAAGGAKTHSSTAVVTYSDVDLKETENLTSLDYATYDVYNKSHSNPNRYDQRMISTMSSKPDITKESTMTNRDAMDRINKYKQHQFQIKKDPKEVAMLAAAKRMRQQSAMQQQLRTQQPTIQQQSMPVRAPTMQQLRSHQQSIAMRAPMDHPTMQQQTMNMRAPMGHQQQTMHMRAPMNHPTMQVRAPIDHPTIQQQTMQLQAPMGHIASNTVGMQRNVLPLNYPGNSNQYNRGPVNFNYNQRMMPKAIQQSWQRPSRSRKLESELKALKNTIKKQQRVINSLVRKDGQY